MTMCHNYRDMRDVGWDTIKRTYPDIPTFWRYVPLPAVRLRTILANLKLKPKERLLL